MASTSHRAVEPTFAQYEQMYPTTAFSAVLGTNREAEEYARHAMMEDLQSLTAELEEARAQRSAVQDDITVPKQSDVLPMMASVDPDLRERWTEFLTSEETIDGEETNLSNCHEPADTLFRDECEDKMNDTPIRELSLIKIPEPQRSDLLERFPCASAKALMAVWEDIHAHHGPPRAIQHRSTGSGVTATLYRCPVMVNGSQCTALSGTVQHRMAHMDRHYKGRYICPGVCRDPWFQNKAALDDHVKRRPGCLKYYIPHISYQVYPHHRWWAYGDSMALECLPEDDTLRKHWKSRCTLASTQTLF